MKKRKLKLVFFTVILIIISITAITSVVLTSYLAEFSSGLKNSSAKIEPSINKDRKQAINILIMGIDIGTPGASEKNNRQWTDTIILLNYNPQSESTNIVSIPRVH